MKLQWDYARSLFGTQKNNLLLYGTSEGNSGEGRNGGKGKSDMPPNQQAEQTHRAVAGMLDKAAIDHREAAAKANAAAQSSKGSTAKMYSKIESTHQAAAAQMERMAQDHRDKADAHVAAWQKHGV